MLRFDRFGKGYSRVLEMSASECFWPVAVAYLERKKRIQTAIAKVGACAQLFPFRAILLIERARFANSIYLRRFDYFTKNQ